MSEKKEIQINRKVIKFISAAILIPLFLTFILEHFGEFDSTAYHEPGAKGYIMADLRLDTRSFTTIFGNYISKHLYSENKKYYRITDDGEITTIPVYPDRIPYYIEAVFVDIIYPLSLSAILIGIFFFQRKFKIKLINN